MPRVGSAFVDVRGDFGPLNQGVDDYAKKSRTRFKAIGKAAALGIGAGLAGAGVLAKGFAGAATEAEKSQARMRTQLKASGTSFDAHKKSIDAAIQSTSRLSGLDDEDLQDAFTNIVRTTGDVNQSLELTGLAADFARAKHMDVAKAGEIVAKVAGGNTGVLGRYGIQLDKNASSSEALAALQDKFAGQAKAYGETNAGAQDRFRVAVENLQEKLGEKLLPILAKVADAASKFITDIEQGKGPVVGFARDVAGVFNTVKAAITGFVERNRADINSFIAAMRNVGVAVRAVVEHVVLPIFRRMIPGLKAIFSGVVTVIRGAVRVVSGVLTGDFHKAWQGVKDIFKGAVKAIGGIIRAGTAPIREAASKIGGAIKAGIEGAIRGIEGVVRGVLNRIISALNVFIRGLNLAIKGFNAINPGKDIGSIGTVGKIADPNAEANGRKRQRPSTATIGHGGRRVTAFSAAVQPAGGSTTLNAPITVVDNTGDAQATAVKTRRQLEQSNRRLAVTSPRG